MVYGHATTGRYTARGKWNTAVGLNKLRKSGDQSRWPLPHPNSSETQYEFQTLIRCQTSTLHVPSMEMEQRGIVTHLII